MGEEQLNIRGAEVRRAAPLEETTPAPAAVPGREPLRLAVEVENPHNTPLYVWTTRRAYDYDAETRVLTLYLTEETPPLPPGITLISDHPRTPRQVEVAANSRTTLDIPVPAVMRRRVPGEGLGMSFVEEPIVQIDEVELHIQAASEPLVYRKEESPDTLRKRMRSHGEVTRATIKPTITKEY